MKTQQEIKTIKDTCDTSKILLDLFSKYQDYDSTLYENYNSETMFDKRKKVKISSEFENANVVAIKHKESILKRILDKIKKIVKR